MRSHGFSLPVVSTVPALPTADTKAQSQGPEPGTQNTTHTQRTYTPIFLHHHNNIIRCVIGEGLILHDFWISSKV